MKVTEDVTTLIHLTSDETTLLRRILASAAAAAASTASDGDDLSRFVRRLHDVLARVTLPKILTLREEEALCSRSISKDLTPSNNVSGPR